MLFNNSNFTFFLSNINSFFSEFALTSFSFDTIVIQFIIFYSFFLLVSASNIYYVALYLFLQIVYFGLILSILQYELFTGFLWVTELTILFIFVLLCFYLNSSGTFSYNSTNMYKFFAITSFFIFFSFSIWSHTEYYFLLIFNYVDLWDDYYEAFSNSLMTDFFGLFTSYYVFNSFFTLLIFFLLFFCSVICIYINVSIKTKRKQNIGAYISIFNFWKSYSNFIFYRKQNLSKQTIRVPSTRIFKKK